MTKRHFIAFLFISLGTNWVIAQDSITISYQEFISVVKKYHPLAYKYQLENKIAEKEIQNARGNFDPQLSAKLGEKEIGNTTYYQQQAVELAIPTWYGVELNGSYNKYQGEKLNNSDTKGEIYQLGITIPLAKNLIIDKRRAWLQQQKLAQKMTFAEQQLKTNELMQEAENTYWQWLASYQIYKLHSKAVTINEERLQFTKKTYNYGERAAIDTVEAFTQKQNFELLKQESYLNFLQQTQELYAFLWKENFEPYDINQVIYPKENINENPNFFDFEFLVQKIKNQEIELHASIRYYLEKGNILEVEKKLKWQSFLPKLDFTYNFLSTNEYRSEYLPPFDNNFQYGLKLEIPIFLRQARANYEIAKLKIDQNNQDILWKKQDLATKITQYSNEVRSYSEQINLAKKNLDNYQKLLRAEEIRYTNGESSLFLINSRESKLIESQEKLIQIQAKYLKSYNVLKWLYEGFSTP